MSRAGIWRMWLLLGFAGSLELATRAGAISRTVLIPPSDMVARLIGVFREGTLLDDIGTTLLAVLIAFALAVSTGFLLGVIIHALPRLRRALDPFFATYYAVPFFVFYPVMIAIFGLSKLPVIAIAYLFAVVAMIVNTLNGIDRIPRVLGKVARVHRLSWADEAWNLKLPAAAPNLFTGVKLAVAYSFIGTIASEFIMAASGLGYSIAYAYNNFDNRTMYALMLFVILLVGAINLALYGWEKKLMTRRHGR
ncbi:MAG: ABC transporter permease [Tagaea sp.]|nr:ABC transporter permease [Tagaea sp.]